MTAFRPSSNLLLRKTSDWMLQRRYAEKMKLTFCAGNQIFYNSKPVRQLDVPSFSGSFGVLADHVPTLAVLLPGVVVVTEDDGKINKIFVSSGTVTVNDDSSVQVLAEEAHPLENLDAAIAKDVLSQAQSQYLAASSDEAKVEAEIAIEVGEALVRALQ